ncbi:MAG: threonine--tRNA ligase [Atribacterota bacterium]|nr:threonine--tRNA ligase [Atribacterota bacterium]MDD5637029.1 threonine--tRNA ligase [Atribacterota bacterium]
MGKINIILLDVDGRKVNVDSEITFYDLIKQYDSGLAEQALAVKTQNFKKDLFDKPQEGDRIEVITYQSKEGKKIFFHSSSHILAQAVQELYPGTRIAIGPAIEEGFYYDFDSDHTFSPEDFMVIEKKMKELVKKNIPLQKKILKKEDAVRLFEQKGEVYKVELLKEIPEEWVTVYQQGDFIDLCRGPHVPSTRKIKAFKLLSVAGAYWRGDEKNKMLQRIYGISFDSQEALDNYLQLLEEAKRRDHRKIGKDLDLYSFHDEGIGFAFFHPRGMIIRNLLEDYWREEHRKRGYQEIKTPIILNKSLWMQSGHWDHYKENMYFTKIDDQDFAVKPMNCPGGVLIYKNRLHSYKEFPLRIAELGLVHRHELSGVLHGLFRVRSFTQDDAHIYMMPSQIIEEVQNLIDFEGFFYQTFGFDYHIELSTKPENAMGSDEVWDKAINNLKSALDDKGISYKINEGDGAFYGPKIDFHLKDCLGRNWQCGTIQLDFLMPEKFDLYYINPQGEKERPVMLHRTIMGSLERFIGILIEQFAGALPTWIAPVQVKLLPIADRHIEYGKNLVKILTEQNIRVELDENNEKIGAKIRKAEMQKIPYMLIFGDQEVANSSVNIRKRGKGDLGAAAIEQYISLINEEIREKSLP